MDHLKHLARDHNKEKRLSLGRISRSKDRGHAKEEVRTPIAKLETIVESPPLVFYGTPANSTGALLSGRLRVVIPEATHEVRFRKLEMTLTYKITAKKPVSRECPKCSVCTEELSKWDFLNETVHLSPGNHDFPFSYLFAGTLPASAQGTLGTVEYILGARGTTVAGEEITFKKPLTIQRAILPGPDRSSIRIFPPTNLTSRLVLPSVVHPIGSFPVQMTLSGIVEKNSANQTRWRLRKMMWRIEEHQKFVSTACDKHLHKVGGEGKGVLHQETRIIGHNEEKSGWKTDFDTPGGEVVMEFDANIKPGCQPLCDLDTKTGFEVKHNLVIELIVAEEFCSNRNTKAITPTGAARVLRMQFQLLVTERSGLGISWDEEMPPVYNDVPESPPGYSTRDKTCTIEDYCGSPLPPLPHYADLEHLDTPTLSGASSDHEDILPAAQRTRLTAEDLVAEPPMMENHRRDLESPPSDHDEDDGSINN